MDMLDRLQRLPVHCFAVLPSTGEVIGIRRGEPGYIPLTQQPGYTLQQLNEGLATPQQVEAMLAGSMFGWHIPAADPENPYYKALTWEEFEEKRRGGR